MIKSTYLDKLFIYTYSLLSMSKPLLSYHRFIMQDQKQRQVFMWPRLVASKLLSSSFGGDSLAADFYTRSDSPASHTNPSDDRQEVHNKMMFVSTWNVGGVPPTSELDLDDWLDTNNNSYDIYVLGFQEIVPLTARNILGREKSSISMEWNSLISATLNKSLSNPQRSQLEAKQKVYPLKDHVNNSRNRIASQHFRCIINKQMVGILVSVWVRGDLQPFIQHPSVSCIGCGIMGCLGNKGAVSVRFLLHETSFCIVCCHLASGGKEGDEMHRNSDAIDIFSRTSFDMQDLSHGLPRKIQDHDRVILLGDLNYRISLPEAKTRSHVEQKEWSILLEKDQLRYEMSNGGAFEGWQESPITFFPTYKYYPNSDYYYGCVDGRKREKRRAPAWCDRILWYGVGMKPIKYDRSELRLSDHRPVRAIFIVEIKLSRDSKSLRSFFSSERFDCVANHIDLLPNEVLSRGRSL